MCDTVVTFERQGRSFFGKNSDRDHGELQITYLSTDPMEELQTLPVLEKKNDYFGTSLPSISKLASQFPNNISTIVSRPVWM